VPSPSQAGPATRLKDLTVLGHVAASCAWRVAFDQAAVMIVSTIAGPTKNWLGPLQRVMGTVHENQRHQGHHGSGPDAR
jgi:hypothetical protein